MISGYHYSVQISRHVVNIVMPDQSGDRLIEYARLALFQQFVDDRDGGDPSDYIHALCANGQLDNITYHGPVYVDAKVVT